MPRRKTKNKREDDHDHEDSEGPHGSFDFPTWGEGPGLFDTLLVCAGIDPIKMDIYDYLDEKEDAERLSHSRRSERKRSKSRKHKKDKKNKNKSRSRSRAAEKDMSHSRGKSNAPRSHSQDKLNVYEERDQSSAVNGLRFQNEASEIRHLESDLPEGMIHSPLLMQPQNSMARLDIQSNMKYIPVDLIHETPFVAKDSGNIFVPQSNNDSHPKLSTFSPISESYLSIPPGTRHNIDPERLNQSDPLRMPDIKSVMPSSKQFKTEKHFGSIQEVGNPYHNGGLMSIGQEHLVDKGEYYSTINSHESNIQRQSYHKSANNLIPSAEMHRKDKDRSMARPSSANVRLINSDLLRDLSLKETRLPPGDAGLTLIKGPNGLIVQKISRHSIAKELKPGDIIIALDGVDISMFSSNVVTQLLEKRKYQMRSLVYKRDGNLQKKSSKKLIL